MPVQNIIPFLQRPIIVDPGKSLSGDFLVPTMDVKNPYCELVFTDNYRFRAPHKILETLMKDNFKENLFQDMKATSLYF